MEQYWFAATEKQWQKFWEDECINAFDPQSEKPVYSIDTPPPTISGNIHIGHIFSYTQAEVVARHKRKMGYNVFYPFGFDNNGLPTERLVEKEIGKRACDMDRKEFIAICLEKTKKYQEDFKTLWKSVGISADWKLEYSTISPLAQKISQRSFLELLQDGKIKQSDAPTLWCTECRTSIAQAELEDRSLESVFYEIPFTLESGEKISIATTRPELMPACTAVFVHPKDERYMKFIGSAVFTALGDKVRISADEKVNPSKWTWAVMCCTYGDETDMYWQKAHRLPEKIILNTAGHIHRTWLEAVDGLHYKKARKTIVDMLRNAGKITKESAIEHSVGTHERCGTPIEILPINQWFIQLLPYKRELLKSAHAIEWHPSYMKKRYMDWVENLKWDWCISRQRFFWIPIPVWHSKLTGEIILPDLEDLPINPMTEFPKRLPAGHTIDDIEPDYNVLDTWATSSLTPDINARIGEVGSLENVIFPMDLRPQAHDIIRTWTFYTIARSHFSRGTVPFKHIMISGHVLAKWREKISKSKNNAGKSPEALIEEYSADAVRYWACGSSLWKDAILDEKEILKWRKLVNKLWSVLGFLKITITNEERKINTPKLANASDAFILLRLREIEESIRQYLNRYDFTGALITFEEFFWHDYCDNYIETIKDFIYFPEKYTDGMKKKSSATSTLYTSFLAIIKLISPFLPHVTEAIYQDFFRDAETEKSIHLTSYQYIPLPDTYESDNIQKGWTLFLKIIELMRKRKTEEKIRLWENISCISIKAPESELKHIKIFQDDIRSVSKARGVEFILGNEPDVTIKP